MYWKVSVGTGPFFLTDFVPGSTATLVRNPNFWMKNPVGPGKGDQLPYMDGLKILIIPDRSTLLAALRTAKVDHYGNGRGGLTFEETTSLKNTAPQILSTRMAPGTTSALYLKIDKEPFNDIRVRRALMMATDFEAIKRDYFSGEAQILIFPMPYAKEYAGAYLRLDDPEMPESVRELYTYNPEKSRALLAEAGYPEGFKTNVVLGSTTDDIDYLSIIADMWSKVNIDLELRPKEAGALTAIRQNRSFDQVIVSGGGLLQNIYRLPTIYADNTWNPSFINDPVVNEAFPKIQAATVTDRAEANRLHKELMKHVLDQAWAIPYVETYQYSVWWPWLKNYSGEVLTGGMQRHFYNWPWLDQELKKSMGY